MNSRFLNSLRLLVLLVLLFSLHGILEAQEQASDPLSDGPKQSVVLENGAPALKFTSNDGSVTYMYFRKRGDEDSFAITLREFKFGGEKTGWMYFTPTKIVFDSDDSKERSFETPKDAAKLKTERGHGGRWFTVKVAGKEKRFMVSFSPPRPLGKQQDPVFDVIERLMSNYNAVVEDFRQQAAKLAQASERKDGDTKNTATGLTSEAIKVVVEVSSEPSGSEIYVDGAFIGSTPSKLSLKAGQHVIKVSRPGFKDWEHRMAIDTSSSKTVNAILEKQPQ
jgi:hypothetical protein